MLNYLMTPEFTPTYLPKRNNTLYPTKEIRIFIAALSIRTTNWTQPKCLSPDGYTNKVRYRRTMECCSIKQNKLLKHATYSGWLLGEHQKHCSEQIKPAKKRLYAVLFHLYNTTENANHSGRKQVSGFCGRVRVKRKGMQGFAEVMGISASCSIS